MLKRAVNTYLDVRRAAGFQLQSAEYYLRDFTRFAMARGETSCSGPNRDCLGDSRHVRSPAA